MRGLTILVVAAVLLVDQSCGRHLPKKDKNEKKKCTDIRCFQPKMCAVEDLHWPHGQCCPRCKHTKGESCEFQGLSVPHGSMWEEDCHLHECWDGVINSTNICPELPMCDPDEMRMYENDPCAECVCIEGEVMCLMYSCMFCETEPIFVPGQCCPICPEPTPAPPVRLTTPLITPSVPHGDTTPEPPPPPMPEPTTEPPTPEPTQEPHGDTPEPPPPPMPEPTTEPPTPEPTHEPHGDTPEPPPPPMPEPTTEPPTPEPTQEPHGDTTAPPPEPTLVD